MTSEDIHNLAAGSDGSLWIGTQDGLLRLKDGIFARYTEKDGLGGNNIAALRTSRPRYFIPICLILFLAGIKEIGPH
jgi:ligand-binding sensor domain-containing protein